METVRLRISIEISTEDVVDTGLSIEAWNALDDDARDKIVKECWNEMASRDDGGISVVTPGAEEV